MTTKPQVFIIESLRFQDEQRDLFEGKIVSQMLKLSGSDPIYVYLRTKKELKKVVGQFSHTNFRYLHFSCHGNGREICLTLDDLDFAELAQMLGACLTNRRVFFSACEVMNKRLAAVLLKGTGCYSVIGPSENITFDRAAAFWSSFYHLMLRDEAKLMKYSQLKKHTSSLQKLFGVRMRYFSTSRSSSIGFKKVSLN